MPFERTFDELNVLDQPPCIHLRSKALYVTGDVNHSHPDEAGSLYCWCNRTQHVMGPDAASATRTRCTAGRECFQESY